MNRMRLPLILCVLYFCTTATAMAQNVNIEDFQGLKDKKVFRLNGGVSVSAAAFSSNEMSGRQPFTYQLNGNLNISFFELLNIPLTFNLNNYGSQFTYPSLPNRFSLHPSYKWAKAHIGDVAMSFSPYTLNGHLFTGAGVELTPGKWTVAAMGGRMKRRVDYDPELPGVMPSFDRYGYGAKVRYDGSGFFAGATFFTAEDRAREVSFQSDSLGIFPQANVAASIEAGLSIVKGLNLSVEYAVSLLTRDTRLPDERNTYDAVKASLDYTFYRNTVGIGYERISPQYETLGAYYFNNDYENITLSYARPLLDGKANIALNGGVQRDDLDDSKESRNTRFVGSANITYAPSERLNMALSGSTFQGHRVIKSQFDYINQTTPYENLDTLNFTQISQNVDFNLSWVTRKSDATHQNLTFFVSYQEAADRQGKYILPGNLTRFLNASTIYAVDLTELNTNFSLGFNASNNYSNQSNFLTFGPLFSANVRLLKKTLTTGLTLSYNRSLNDNALTAEVYNCRWNANYRFLKKHSIQSDIVFQHRKRVATAINRVHSLTAQIRYSYSF